MVDKALAGMRKLSAILHADLAGYSALMAADETGTHVALRRCLELAAAAVGARGGRVVGTAGDALLADFPSVVDALDAAIAFQEALAGHERDRPADRRLAFRIGINLGDVIVDGDDIFGDGVNVAARIQGLASPGGIAVSELVHSIARSRSDVRFRDLGRHRVKNIAEPVHAYAVEWNGSSAPSGAKWPRRTLQLAVALTILTSAAGLWTAMPLPEWLAALGRHDTALAPAASRDARPAVAVLPFRDDGPAAHAYFSAGVTEDTIAQLGRFSGLTVLSWSAVAPYRDKAVPLDELGRDLDVRYVVDGSIRRSGEMLRVAVQLSDASEGTLLWSERYDEPVADLFALQDRISRAIVEELSVKLTRIEQRRAFQKPTSSLGAYDLVLRGRDLLHRTERDANLDARAMFERATALDPDYADAWVGLGSTHRADVYWGWSERPWKSVETAEAHAEKATALDPDNAGAYALMADLLRIRHEVLRAQSAIDRALELNPNSADALAIRGDLLILSGRHREAAAALERSLRLNPHSPSSTFATLALAYYAAGEYTAVVELVANSGRSFAEDPSPHALLAAALARLGRPDEARRAAERVRAIYPFFDARLYAANILAPADVPNLVEGLRLAGLD